MLLSRCASTTIKDVAQKIGQRLLLYSPAFDANKDGSLISGGAFSNSRVINTSLISRNVSWMNAFHDHKSDLQCRKFTTVSNSDYNKPYETSILNKEKHTNKFYFNQIRKQCELKDSKTTSLTVWGNIKEIKSSPKPALILGFGGLIPFVSIPAYMVAIQDFSLTLSLAQMSYAACILSFVGGVRWGMAIPENSLIQTDWRNLGYSVVPSLLAWVSLLLPSPLDVFILIGGLAMAGYFDMVSWAYPAWFKGLRFTLTLVAVLSLWTTFIIGFLIESNDQDIKAIISNNND